MTDHMEKRLRKAKGKAQDKLSDMTKKHGPGSWQVTAANAEYLVVVKALNAYLAASGEK